MNSTGAQLLRGLVAGLILAGVIILAWGLDPLGFMAGW